MIPLSLLSSLAAASVSRLRIKGPSMSAALTSPFSSLTFRRRLGNSRLKQSKEQRELDLEALQTTKLQWRYTNVP